ncbi:MAG: S-layer homology domain-containing protein [Alicyclobacillus sp.]|nr:S-layer homology domain-containing protein [Alicyclobacillus sp.]
MHPPTSFPKHPSAEASLKPSRSPIPSLSQPRSTSLTHGLSRRTLAALCLSSCLATSGLWLQLPQARADTIPPVASSNTGTAPDTAPAGDPADTFSAQQAEQLARQLLQIPPAYNVANTMYNAGPNQPPTWTLTFQAPDNQALPAINVSIDAQHQRIVSYYRPQQADHLVFPPPLSVDEATQMARQWAQKLYPDALPQTKLLPLQPQAGSLTQPMTYTFTFERIVNGLPAPFDGWTLTLGQEGELISLQCHWTDAAFPPAHAALTPDQATALYQQNLPLRLQYSPVWHSDGHSTLELVYQPVFPGYPTWWGDNYAGDRADAWPVFDATTGQPLNPAGQPQPLPDPPPVQPLDPGGPTLPIPLPKVNWNEQQCLDNARKRLQVPSSAEFVSENEWKTPDGVTSWHFNWHVPGGESFDVTVDATHGLIIGFNRFPPASGLAGINPSSDSPALTQDQINAAAAAFIRQVWPTATGGLALQPANWATPLPKGSGAAHLQTTFQVVALVHGLPDLAQSGSLNVNPQTGTVENFWMNLPSLPSDLPNPGQALTLDQAKAAWVKARPLQLQYRLTQPQLYQQMAAKVGGDAGPGTQFAPAAPRVVLVYAPDVTAAASDMLNAVSGSFVPANDLSAYSGPIVDLAGSNAAAQLQLLVQRRLVDVDGEGRVHPDQVLTRGAFVKLLVDALGQQGVYSETAAASPAAQQVVGGIPKDSPQYKEIVAAFQLGWLPTGQPFNPEAPLTRADACVLLARALGYGDLLQHPEALRLDAADASQLPPTVYAAAALANAFQLFALTDGSFHANQPVTLADAAIAVVQAATLVHQPNRIRPL